MRLSQYGHPSGGVQPIRRIHRLTRSEPMNTRIPSLRRREIRITPCKRQRSTGFVELLRSSFVGEGAFTPCCATLARGYQHETPTEFLNTVISIHPTDSSAHSEWADEYTHPIPPEEGDLDNPVQAPAQHGVCWTPTEFFCRGGRFYPVLRYAGTGLSTWNSDGVFKHGH